MVQTRGERLRIARARLFPSARKAADALEMPPATYGAHERAETPGGRDYGPDEAKRYARRFRVKPEWLLTGVGGPPAEEGVEPDDAGTAAPNSVKVKGYVGAGAEAHFYAVSQGDLDEVPAPDDATEKTVAVEIRGDSLGGLFDRWLVFYDDVQRPVGADLVGRLCVVGLPDDRVLIKKIRHGTKKGLFTLLSERGQPIPDVQIEWAALVKTMKPRQ